MHVYIWWYDDMMMKYEIYATGLQEGVECVVGVEYAKQAVGVVRYVMRYRYFCWYGTTHRNNADMHWKFLHWMTRTDIYTDLAQYIEIVMLTSPVCMTKGVRVGGWTRSCPWTAGNPNRRCCAEQPICWLGWRRFERTCRLRV